MSNLTYVKYVGDGVTKQFPITATGSDMAYLRTSDIHVYVDDVEVDSSIDIASPHIVTLTEAPSSGSEVLVRREMPEERPYSDFERGNNFGYRQVNNSFLQQLYLTQEILDGFLPNDFYFKSDVNMGGNRITNLGDAVDPDDATKKSVTDGIKNRLNSLENSNISGTVNVEWIYNNGAAIGGELFISYPYEKKVNSVFLNGIKQTYGLAFDYDTSTRTLELAEELEEGDILVIQFGSGIVDRPLNYLTSPDGTIWLVTVDNDGVLEAVEV